MGQGTTAAGVTLREVDAGNRRTLYASLGLEQTGEFEDDEPVARRAS
jgi:hypothetical protein